MCFFLPLTTSYVLSEQEEEKDHNDRDEIII